MINDKIIVALDTQSPAELDNLIFELKDTASYVKIGMELYYTFGNPIIKRMKDSGFKVFLDLKMHDIPTTVYKAAKTLAKNGVDMLNVHAAGGIEMMKAALEGVNEINDESILIAVTQLTSTDQNILNNELYIPGNINNVILAYAQTTYQAGLAGVVCSAHEVKMLKENIGIDFKCITPGIRPQGLDANDQKRIMTPKEAISMGTDYMVIGRAITQAASPKEAYLQILKEIS